MDLFLAVVRRGWVGLRSPFSPDKLHLHHRLLEIGHSHRRAVLIMWLWAALVSLGTVLVSLYPGRTVVWALLGVMAVGHHRAHVPHPDHPQAPDRRSSGAVTVDPVSSRPRLCASFHKHQQRR